MFKKIWFQVHWFIGITAGTVLMAIGVTGAVLSFREEIIDWINPGVVHVAARQQAVLTPQQIIERLHAAVPDERVANLTLYAEPGASARINFAPPPGVRRGELRYADPYTGALLPPPAGNAFFEFIERFHRWLLLPVDNGKVVAGSLSMCLLVLALSGLYMRWPRRALNWRAWFRLDFGLSGRSFLWNLHSVIGTWALVMYVIFTTTGMYWAFDWFKQGVNALAGQETPMRMAPPQKKDKKDKGEKAETPPAPLDLTLAWSVFQREAGPYTLVSMRLPEKAAQAIQFTYLPPDAAHERARDRLTILPLSGEVRQNERFADKSRGGRFIGAIYPLHMGTYFGLPGRIVMALAALIMPLFGITGWMLYLDRRRKKRAVRAERALLDQSGTATIRPAVTAGDKAPDEESILLAYATQAGQAERIALHTAAVLQKAGVTVTVQSLAMLDPERLRHFHRALFVASTFGEGEPPDSARRFARQLAHQQGGALSHVQYGLLALGDRHYEKFCGFGHSLDHWLRSQGAQAFFPMIEVDNNAPADLARWQHELAALTGGAPLEEAPAKEPEAAYAGWILRERKLLNPGSCGSGIYHLEFESPAGLDPQWQSGALAEMLPRHAPDRIALFLERVGLDGDIAVRHQGATRKLADALARSVLPAAKSDITDIAPQALADSLQPLASRRYSVASVQEDGRVHLLVRQVAHEDGFGLASGWLTEYAQPGDAVDMRLLENNSFALAPEPGPAIFIGNGSGLAGLRSHLRARIARGQRRNWLLFGERKRANDFLYREEIEQWMQDDMLSRVDIAFSRDQPERIYVQDKLRQAADMLKAWISEGAVLYVCGSLDGMAAGIDAALSELLGEAALDDLIAQGRYRRDVY
ncbi:sulfite reductase flavoprotein subunit alpha [Herbaspirillum sp. RV1423]|uniref:sulfite reductase flavoprotein subunit alpha n=1 Tax=Herbaspirillum sp. RV1423 TaxID=1443993 RepID=UPI0004AF6461|nr:sulfite reductase flavoprotein subunit alpha [Herbaspirillum sp. RV1423]